MADLENPAATPEASDDDTQTKKTIKVARPEGSPSTVTLRPAVPVPPPEAVAPAEQAAPIADPLSGRDTDTGNLEVLSDTQTRKTVKLKPINPMMEKRPVSLDNVPTAPAPEAAAPATNTRKVLMLKPKPVGVQPAVDPSKQTIELPGAAPEAPKAVNPSKQTVVLAPMAASAESDTIKVAKVGAEDAPAEASAAAPAEENDATVKIKRPAIPRPAAPAPAAPAAAAAPAAPAAPNIVEPDADKATVKLARPTIVPPKPSVVPPKPAVVPPKAEAAPAVPAEKPAEEKEEPKAGGLGLKKDENETKSLPPMVKDMENEIAGLKPGKKSRASAGAPSVLYTVLGALTLIALLVAAVATAIQYLNIHETERIGGKPIDIPVLSEQVK